MQTHISAVRSLMNGRNFMIISQTVDQGMRRGRDRNRPNRIQLPVIMPSDLLPKRATDDSISSATKNPLIL